MIRYGPSWSWLVKSLKDNSADVYSDKYHFFLKEHGDIFSLFTNSLNNFGNEEIATVSEFIRAIYQNDENTSIKDFVLARIFGNPELNPNHNNMSEKEINEINRQVRLRGNLKTI